MEKKESFFHMWAIKVVSASPTLVCIPSFSHPENQQLTTFSKSGKLCQTELFLFVYAIIEARDINILNFMQIRVEEEIFVGTFHWHNVTQIVGQSRTLRCFFSM